MRVFREHLNYLPHGGPLDAVVLDAEHGDEEQMCRFVLGHRFQLGVDDAGDVLLAAAGRLLAPLHDVHTFPKIAHWASARQELQQHDAETVNVALLVDPQCVRILCKETKGPQDAQLVLLIQCMPDAG